MVDGHVKDDEHYAPESGDREEGQDFPTETAEPKHAKDDEHYAPES